MHNVLYLIISLICINLGYSMIFSGSLLAGKPLEVVMRLPLVSSSDSYRDRFFTSQRYVQNDNTLTIIIGGLVVE
jgi:hypothetical protein